MKNLPDTIVGRFFRLKEAAPEVQAFNFYDPQSGLLSSLTRAELWNSASSVAAQINPDGPSKSVLIVMPIGKELIAAHLGSQIAGCSSSIFTHPSNKVGADAYQKNLKNALALLHPDYVITTPEFSRDIQGLISAGTRALVIDQDDPTINTVQSDRWLECDAGDLAIVQYSSGSTGLQKGIGLSHQMVLRQIQQYTIAIQLESKRDHICSWLPLYHDMGLFTSYLMPLVTGTPVSLIDPFKWIQDPLALLKLITEVKGTLCWQPNFAFNLLASRCSDLPENNFNLSSIRSFISCSEPTFPNSLLRFRDALTPQKLSPHALGVCYAMAENSFAVTSTDCQTSPYRHMSIDPSAYKNGRIVPVQEGGIDVASCGKPIPDCGVKIVDPTTRSNLPADQVGEIAIRSPFLFNEYIKNRDATEACRDQDGWYYTGDLGFMDHEELFVSGRKKDLIIVAGRNFYPQDLEGIASSCKGVIPGRVVALSDRDNQLGTERVIVIVESELTDPSSKKNISNNIRQRIFEDLDCPVSDVKVVAPRWLYKTSSGKVARQENLRKYYKSSHWHNFQKILGETPKAGLTETTIWGAILAVALYAYLTLYVIDNNTSWNIYAGF